MKIAIIGTGYAGLVSGAEGVTKSAAPVGANRNGAEVIRRPRPEAAFGVASNPAFQRETVAQGIKTPRRGDFRNIHDRQTALEAGFVASEGVER